MHEITQRSAGEIAHGVKSGDFTCKSVVQAFADRIERLNGRVNAIVQSDLEGALTAAEAQDRSIADGAVPGPLAGVPIAIKDNFDAKGFATTFGAAALRGNRPDGDSLHVARMKAAGAIVMGKTNLPEFAFGEDTDNALWGRTKNPYALNRTAGSSSGGAGAALALDLVALADGSDLGGSVRIPAAWCNLVGLRPTSGVAPTVPTRAPYDKLHVVGPIARCADDVRLAMSVMAGPDPRSPLLSPVGREAFDAPLSGQVQDLRIGFAPTKCGFRIEPTIQSALESAVSALGATGATINDADPGIAFAARQHRVSRAVAAADYAGWAADEHGLELGFVILDLIAEARKMTGFQMERAQRIYDRAWAKLADFFQDHDLLCWPVTTDIPFIAGTSESDKTDWGPVQATPALDLPAASVPAGMSPEGLPIGLQLLGPPGSDRKILEAAAAVERALNVREKNLPQEMLQSI